MALLKVDYRERDLMVLLPNAVSENLEVGDIQIIRDDGSNRIIIERKTLADLQSSIKDGRYREQKSRMLTMAKPHQIAYIIEGDPLRNSNPSVIGSILNTQFRDGMHVIFTNGKAATAQWVHELWCRVNQTPDTYLPSQLVCLDGESTDSSPFPAPGADWIDSAKIKTKKIENITPIVCLELQLGQIPGLSNKLAKAIVNALSENDRTMSGLIRTITNDPTFLNKVPLIGPKKASAIYEFLGAV